MINFLLSWVVERRRRHGQQHERQYGGGGACDVGQLPTVTTPTSRRRRHDGPARRAVLIGTLIDTLITRVASNSTTAVSGSSGAAVTTKRSHGNTTEVRMAGKQQRVARSSRCASSMRRPGCTPRTRNPRRVASTTRTVVRNSEQTAEQHGDEGCRLHEAPLPAGSSATGLRASVVEMMTVAARSPSRPASDSR